MIRNTCFDTGCWALVVATSQLKSIYNLEYISFKYVQMNQVIPLGHVSWHTYFGDFGRTVSQLWPL